MERESLEKVARMINLHLMELGIDNSDKLELIINLSNFLEPKEYDDNIKVLQKHKFYNRRLDSNERQIKQ